MNGNILYWIIFLRIRKRLLFVVLCDIIIFLYLILIYICRKFISSYSGVQYAFILFHRRESLDEKFFLRWSMFHAFFLVMLHGLPLDNVRSAFPLPSAPLCRTAATVIHPADRISMEKIPFPARKKDLCWSEDVRHLFIRERPLRAMRDVSGKAVRRIRRCRESRVR